MSVLLSIIIPTRNRGVYCLDAIKSILNIPSQDFELVIQDNSDDQYLKDSVECDFNDLRLKYYYLGNKISSIDNFNFALEKANGEYFCLIGDDDGVISEILNITRWAKSKGVDSICSSRLISYVWPGVHTRYNTGALMIPDYSKKITHNDPIKALPELLKNGIINYSKFNLPRLYHGIIKKTCLDSIKNTTGHYIGGLSPDIYLTTALCGIVKNHIVIDMPFTIPGICNQSSTADATKQKHCGRLEDAPHLKYRENYIWELEIPKYYSVQTIWAESCLKSINENEINIPLSLFSLEKLVANSLIYSYSIAPLIIKETNKLLIAKRKSILISYLKISYYLLKTIIFIFRKKIRFLLSSKKSEYIIMQNISCISDATIEIEKISYLKKDGITSNL